MFDTLGQKFTKALKVLSGKSKISEGNIEEVLQEIKTALLEADVNFKVVKDFISKVKEAALGQKVIDGVNPGEQFTKIVHDKLSEIMGSANDEMSLDRPPVIPVLVVGLNGQGKTTFSGKLANYLKEKKQKSVFLIPADNFRPAAKDQLQILAKSIGVDIFDSDLTMAPARIVEAGLKKAAELKKDIAIIDTAGRLHVNDDLMRELKDVKTSLVLSNPEVLLVADAMTGQEAVSVAKTFHEAIGLTGIVLSKMDSDARGGAALSIRYSTGVPIRYISTGEKMKDFELFHPDRLAGRILGMGDVVTLVEKAQESIDQNEAERMMKNFQENRFTVDDFLKQMNMMNSLGPLGSIMKMIPGMGGMMDKIGDLAPAEKEMKKMKVIISSMTKEERANYRLVKDSRIERIAKGSGTTGKDVREFLNKFQSMEKMMGMMSGMMKGKMPSMPGMKGFRQGPQDMMGEKKKKGGGGKGPWGKSYF